MLNPMFGCLAFESDKTFDYLETATLQNKSESDKKEVTVFEYDKPGKAKQTFGNIYAFVNFLLSKEGVNDLDGIERQVSQSYRNVKAEGGRGKPKTKPELLSQAPKITTVADCLKESGPHETESILLEMINYASLCMQNNWLCIDESKHVDISKLQIQEAFEPSTDNTSSKKKKNMKNSNITDINKDQTATRDLNASGDFDKTIHDTNPTDANIHLRKRRPHKTTNSSPIRFMNNGALAGECVSPTKAMFLAKQNHTKQLLQSPALAPRTIQTFSNTKPSYKSRGTSPTAKERVAKQFLEYEQKKPSASKASLEKLLYTKGIAEASSALAQVSNQPNYENQSSNSLAQNKTSWPSAHYHQGHTGMPQALVGKNDSNNGQQKVAQLIAKKVSQAQKLPCEQRQEISQVEPVQPQINQQGLPRQFPSRLKLSNPQVQPSPLVQCEGIMRNA
jgi:hypothetical protein